MKKIIKPVVRLMRQFKFNESKDRAFIEAQFLEKFERPINLAEPATYNEKLQWHKLNDRRPIRTLLADKLAVRDYIAATIGEEYLIPLITYTSDPKQLTSQSLPDYPVIIKANHASGKVFIVKDKTQFNFAEMQASLTRQLNYNFYYALREWQYKNIPPQAVVEKLMLTESGGLPEDYKIHCFHGKPTFIQVDTDRFNGHKRNIYDTEWQLLDIEYNFPQGEGVAQPKNLKLMLQIAQQLSERFNYCRIDLYEIQGKVYFGEFTFTPEGGFGRFKPDAVDLEWGQLFELDASYR